MTNDDNSIIERIQGGETSEFAQLVKRYGPSLMVFVGRIVGVQEDTEDVVQNTFVAAYQHMKDFDSQKASVSTWLQQRVLPLPHERQGRLPHPQPQGKGRTLGSQGLAEARELHQRREDLPQRHGAEGRKEVKDSLVFSS